MYIGHGRSAVSDCRLRHVCIVPYQLLASRKFGSGQKLSSALHLMIYPMTDVVCGV